MKGCDLMELGFVGAGKVGVTLGRYFTEQKTKLDDSSINVTVSGYYSRTQTSADLAATWTNSKTFSNLSTLVEDCDIIFLTVPDSLLETLWDEMKFLPLEGKIICHCSGAYTSKMFQKQADNSFYTYSIHPLFAISSKEQSYKTMGQAFFTLEGEEKYLPFWVEFFQRLGNPCRIISSEHKVKYHAAAVFSSNLVLSVANIGEKLLMDCGFSMEEARVALSPILRHNVENYCNVGLPQALTGPVERGDSTTISKHLSQLEGEIRDIYTLLSGQLIGLAKKKNPLLDISSMEELLMKKENEMKFRTIENTSKKTE